jgi:hypothetical protein
MSDGVFLSCQGTGKKRVGERLQRYISLDNVMLTLLARYGLINSVEAITPRHNREGNNIRKSTTWRGLFLDADAAREGSFAYYAMEVLEGDSEPSHECGQIALKARKRNYARLEPTS